MSNAERAESDISATKNQCTRRAVALNSGERIELQRWRQRGLMKVCAAKLARDKAHGGLKRSSFESCGFEVCAYQAGIAEVRANEHASRRSAHEQIGRAQIGVVQVDEPQVYADEVAALEIGARQVGPLAGGALRFHPFVMAGHLFLEGPVTIGSTVCAGRGVIFGRGVRRQ